MPWETIRPGQKRRNAPAMRLAWPNNGQQPRQFFNAATRRGPIQHFGQHTLHVEHAIDRDRGLVHARFLAEPSPQSVTLNVNGQTSNTALFRAMGLHPGDVIEIPLEPDGDDVTTWIGNYAEAIKHKEAA